MTKLNIDELKKKIEEFCAAYAADYGICFVIEQNEGDYHISGNLCPVCARDVLAGYVFKNSIQHNKHVH